MFYNAYLSIFTKILIMGKKLESPYLNGKTTKICGLCKIDKPLSEYLIRKNRPAPTAYCKECNKKHGKERYHKKKLEPGFVEKHRKASLSANYKMTYGVTLEEKIKRWEIINKQCECCGNIMPTIGSAKMDHNHTNGQIRGLICNKCNIMIGALEYRDLDKAITYLEKWKNTTDSKFTGKIYGK